MKREMIIELAYRYGFDGSDGIFKWDNEEHFKAGFFAFERFVNDFEETVKRDSAEIAAEMGALDVADAIRSSIYRED